MFEPKQIIEGKIFIHYRRHEMLAIFSQYELPGCYFEYLINTQNFTGHFVEVVADPQIISVSFIFRSMAKIKSLPSTIRLNR